MTVFAPLDVQTPVDRRKQLLSKLMQQYAQSSQAAAQTQMPVAVHALGAPSGGQPFRGVNSAPNGPHTLMTNPNALSDISPDVRAHLGPGGFHIPLPTEHSGMFGDPVNPPGLGVTNAPSQPNPPVHIGGPVSLPLPPGVLAAPAPAGGASVPGQALSPPTVPGQASTTGVTPVGQAQPIALGNGLFYNPVTNQVTGGSADVSGNALRNLGTAVGPGRVAGV